MSNDQDRRRCQAALISTTCPACGRPKHRRHSFCRRCYGRLPADIRAALWSRIGAGYEGAYRLALQELEEAV